MDNSKLKNYIVFLALKVGWNRAGVVEKIMLKWEENGPNNCYFSGHEVHGGHHGLMASAMSTKWMSVASRSMANATTVMTNVMSSNCTFFAFPLAEVAFGSHVVVSAMENAMVNTMSVICLLFLCSLLFLSRFLVWKLLFKKHLK